ncbi:MAG: mannose-6-phosphate isomerase, class I [Bacteroidota bacterium]
MNKPVTSMFRTFPIKGAIQNYAWGGTQFIPDLVGTQNIENKPFAELWMGMHHRGPAVIEGIKQTLADFIESNPKEILGEKVAAQFDDRLPFLFKILDVNKMLSIQTHPTKRQAEIGFAKEEKAGIPITAKHRNFKDDNHKPEIMIALTDFWLLHGFQQAEAIKTTLKSVPEFVPLLPYFKDQNIYNLYKYIMELSQAEVDELLTPLQERLSQEKSLLKSNPDYWARLAFEDYTRDGHFDRGIFSIYLFNLVNIPIGQAIFQDAGIPHAYLEGVNVELMANSDNVFRGGLTPKHIDVPELMNHLVTEGITPKILEGETLSANEKIYRTPAPDFEVSQIKLAKGERHFRHTNAPDILIVMEGSIEVQSDETLFTRNRGEIFFVSYGVDYELIAEREAVIYRASVPIFT